MSSEKILPLNPDQLRKLKVSLRLLQSDLERLLWGIKLERGAEEDCNLRAAIEETLRAVQRLGQNLAVRTDREVPLAREVAATAEVWIARLEDLKAHRLASYGTLPVTEISRALDPQVEELQRALSALAKAAGATVATEASESNRG
ncbi:MAG: hypothetical protein KatS3mg081_2516 [Gemmatimonadales bacterium]|nr:hypothetical protein HRbin33_01544 [bacterium HR33]GIW53161.1 MAG: hypothetical protein KatS3mg081_2516 [Gemmatimonadales bacterium]